MARVRPAPALWIVGYVAVDKAGSKLIEAVSSGWPQILASLKSLLETGQPLDETRRWPKGL